MKRPTAPPPILAASLALAAVLALAAPARADLAAGDTMVFQPVDRAAPPLHERMNAPRIAVGLPDDEWLQAPFGDRLLTHPDPWRRGDRRHGHQLDVLLDYNRVDLLRYGAGYQAQAPETMLPRVGARIEYATGRRRTLYGMQIEQPVAPPARLVIGASLVRRTDHSDLQQVEDLENSLALLFARQDYRDYFEREGAGLYLAWRVPDFSTVSTHVRSDEYRSLERARHVTSWFEKDRPLRDNPAIDEGRARRAIVRLERLAHQTRRTRAGFYHWAEVERAGGRLGGDFEYTRALADLRSVLRLSPAVTLSLRGVAGATLDGALPRQMAFLVGGVDGLRGHPHGAFRGDQMVLMQAEYSIGLWALDAHGLGSGLHVLAFVDAGTAWDQPAGRWDAGRQKLGVDGGVGFATGEDDLRVTFARDLQRDDADFVVQVRLQRPF